MRSRLLLVSALPALGLAACSLVTNFGDLASGGPVDAGAGGTDAATDAPADAVVPEDAPADGLVESAPAPFCSGRSHAFCADFDEGSLLDGWTRMQVDPLGTIEPSTLHFVSPKTSFHSFLPRRAAGDKEDAVLVKDLPGAWKHTLFDFDMFLARPDFQTGDINAAFLQLTFAGSGTGSGQTFYIPIGDGYSQVTGPGMIIQLSEAHYDELVHFHLDVRPGTSVSVTVNGRPVPRDPLGDHGRPRHAEAGLLRRHRIQRAGPGPLGLLRQHRRRSALNPRPGPAPCDAPVTA
jgi:hypothetical protein